MGLRDWSVKRILGIWTGWMAGLLVALLGAIVVSPSGVTLRIAGGDGPLYVRIGLAIMGLVAVCTPPAILTYAWYLKRLRAWSEQSAAEKERSLADAYAGILKEGEVQGEALQQRYGQHARRPNSHS
jgi:hypothetical protein